MKFKDPIITIELDNWPAHLAVIMKAVAFKVRNLPKGWKPVEYACTKADAQMSVGEIIKQVDQGTTPSLRYSKWSLLLGEIGRHYNAIRNSDNQTGAVTLATYDALKALFDKNPEVADFIARGEKIEKLDAQRQRLQKAHLKRMDKINAEIQKLNAGE
jgi:hypothetical protein